MSASVCSIEALVFDLWLPAKKTYKSVPTKFSARMMINQTILSKGSSVLCFATSTTDHSQHKRTTAMAARVTEERFPTSLLKTVRWKSFMGIPSCHFPAGAANSLFNKAARRVTGFARQRVALARPIVRTVALEFLREAGCRVFQHQFRGLVSDGPLGGHGGAFRREKAVIKFEGFPILRIDTVSLVPEHMQVRHLLFRDVRKCHARDQVTAAALVVPIHAMQRLVDVANEMHD